jgi:hypothetical protein
MPEMNTSGTPMSPDEAALERARLDAEFRREVLAMEAPPADESWPRRADVINRPPPYAPDGTPGDRSPWPEPPPRDESQIAREINARNLLKQLLDDLLKARLNGANLSPLDDVRAKVRELEGLALEEARREYGSCPEAAALAEARAALTRARQAVARAAAGQAEAQAAFQEAVSTGSETQDVHAALAGHVAAGRPRRRPPLTGPGAPSGTAGVATPAAVPR